MTENSRAGLYKKIAAVTQEVGRVPKNGRNEFHKYNYATESDITDSLRDLLKEHGLAFLPPSVEDFWKEGDITRVRMKFGLADTETGEVHEFTIYGEGQDKGDKGAYKAYTGAVKYALMKTFLVATGDDPEADVPAAKLVSAPRQRPSTPSPFVRAKPMSNSTGEPAGLSAESKQIIEDEGLDRPDLELVGPDQRAAIVAEIKRLHLTKSTMIVMLQEFGVAKAEELTVKKGNQLLDRLEEMPTPAVTA